MLHDHLAEGLGGRRRSVVKLGPAVGAPNGVKHMIKACDEQ